MAEVINLLNELTKGEAIIITDVEAPDGNLPLCQLQAFKKAISLPEGWYWALLPSVPALAIKGANSGFAVIGDGGFPDDHTGTWYHYAKAKQT